MVENEKLEIVKNYSTCGIKYTHTHTEYLQMSKNEVSLVYSLSTCYVPGIVLGSENIMVRKPSQSPDIQEISRKNINEQPQYHVKVLWKEKVQCRVIK